MTAFPETIHVLHVDDEPDVADLAARFLERADERFTVVTATSAEQGLAVLADSAVDCIVSDYDMPGQNGIEFLEAVRETEPDLPFILYTGKGSEEIASEAISAGVTEYMQKGTGTDQYTVLANRIANSVEQYRAEQDAERTRERLAELSRSSTDCLWLFDRDWEELLFISGYEDVWDRPESAIRADPKDFLQAVHPDDRALVRDAMDRLSNGESIDVEFRILRSDDRQGSVWLKGEPVFDETEDVVRVVGFTRDITDRKEQSRRLETLISNLPGIAYQCRNEPNWPMDLVRGECEALTGYSAAAIERGDVDWSEDILHPDDADRMWERVQDAIDADRPFEVTYRIQTKDGTTRWMWERGRLVDSDVRDGEILEGFITDITDRKQREAELRRTERRYQAVFDDPNILVGLLETDGTVLDVNQTAMAYVADTLGEIVGTPFRETPWFDQSPGVKQRVDEWIDCAASGEYGEFEADLARPDGEPYTIEGVFRPVTTDDGEVVSLLFSAGDVTERMERERELERYEAYLQESTDIITVLDADGTVKYQSPAVTRILGYEPGALLGRDGFAYIHPADVENVQSAFADLVGDPSRTVTVECRFRTADDRWRWLEVRGTNQLGNDPIDGIVTNNRDITDRKEREQELERTTTVLSTLIETLPVGVLAEDESRNVLAINRRLFELFDMPGTPEAVVGADCERIAEEVSELFADPDAFVERIDDLVSEREPTDDEALALADGRTFERTYRPIELPDGDGHLWVYRDVTERMDRQQALEAVLDQMDDAIFVHPRDEPFTFVNQAAVERYGFPEDELHTMTPADLNVADESTQVDERAQHVIQTGQQVFETEHRTRSGETIPVEINATTVTFRGESSILSIARDVTERKRAEREFRETKERLDLAVDGAGLGVWDWNMQTDAVEYNDQWAEMLGHTIDEIEPHVDAWKRRVHPEDRDAVETALETHIAGETEYYDTEHRMQTADGDWKWIRDIGKVVERTPDGDPARAVGIHVDVTERKEREQELQRQNARLDQFASVVSHDLRNPLNVAQSRLQLVTEECNSDHFDAMERALDRMERIIEDVLWLSREGRDIGSVETISLGDAVAAAWSIVADDIDDVELAVDETNGLGTIEADEDRLRQLLENVLRNAVEHGGSSVTVTVGKLADGFYVADDGPGIPPDDREKIFEAGYSTSDRGTGFGLSIVAQIAEAHGWAVSVTESDSGGARFEVSGVTS